MRMIFHQYYVKDSEKCCFSETMSHQGFNTQQSLVHYFSHFNNVFLVLISMYSDQKMTLFIFNFIKSHLTEEKNWLPSPILLLRFSVFYFPAGKFGVEVSDSDKIPLSCSSELPYINILSQCECIPSV